MANLNPNAPALDQTNPGRDLAQLGFSATLTLNPEPDFGRIISRLEPSFFWPKPQPDPERQAEIKYAVGQAVELIHCLDRNALKILRCHLSLTVPDPASPQIWPRRLLPTCHYQEYKDRLLELQEDRITATFDLSEIINRLLLLEDQSDAELPNPKAVKAALRAATALQFQFDPPPTAAQFLKEQLAAYTDSKTGRLAQKLLPRPLRQRLVDRQARKAQARYDLAIADLTGHQPTADYADRMLRQFFPPNGIRTPGKYEAWHHWNFLPGVHQLNQRRKRQQASSTTPKS